MGDLLSTPSKNPTETQHTTAMSSSETSQNPQSESEKSTQDSETLESHKSQTPEPTSDPPSTEQNETLDGPEQINVEEGDEEEEGECGFCLYMKGGGCRESFTAWEKCIEEAEKNKEDIVDKCFEVTGALKKCMEAHTDYYGPILQAEKAAEAEAVRELEKEKEQEKQAAAASSEVNSAEGSEEQVSEKS